ncbi:MULTISPECIES: hypothetical protein [Proteus]|nr:MULTISPECIES: hypothetical protein [Proteus]EHZ6744796.1 hypothetical protein [Proteus mirabilis]EKT8414581.1 hypothetical protein [Proteus mirabilis]EKU5731803.1 hypothetical protein [Proteus mirabilis]EKV2746734.1 hypothetical protein [Proteus mirabilis]EKY0305171.1 hypothetical protein [Proteus mirabilis]
MKTGTLHYKMTLRRYMKPMLIIAALTNWRWLTDLCFKVEAVPQGKEVELSGE